MEEFKTSIIITLVLGFGSVLCLFFMILALLDIYQGTEPDLLNEWIAVSFGIITILLFNLATIFTLIRLLTRKSQTIGSQKDKRIEA